MPKQADIIEIEASAGFPEKLWAGTQDSLRQAVIARSAIQAAISAGTLSATGQADPNPYLLTISGSIGIIAVNGPLVNEDSPYNKYYGVTSYYDIRRALLAAATNPDIKAIAMDVGSPGGAVSGVEDTAALVEKIDRNMKAVYAYSGSTIASAAIWAVIPARRLEIGATTLAGSIGIMYVHTEYTKMHAEMGVTKTVIRAGEFKALANPNEALTDKAKAQMEDITQDTYKVFMGRVASSLKMDYAKADRTVGQGREFVGQAAVDAGLASRVTSFDEFIARIQTALDKASKGDHNPANQNRGFNAMPRAALTQAQINAMQASGIDQSMIDALLAQTNQEDGAAAAAAAATAAAATAAAAAATAAATAAPAAAAATAAPAAPAAATTAASQGAAPDAMTALIDRLTRTNTDLVTAQAQVAALSAQVAAHEADMTAMRDVVVGSISAMTVAMNGSPKDYTATKPADLIAEHKAMKTSFEAKFPNGQVSAASNSTETQAEAPTWLGLAERTRKA